LVSKSALRTLKEMQIRFLLTSFVLVSSALHAATIQIASDLVNEYNNRTGENVFITPDPAWAVAPAGAGWISDDNTPPSNASRAVTIFTEEFFLPGTVNIGSVRIWAYDTASVRLDGVHVGPPANILQDTACAAGPIDCPPLEFADISLDGLSQGAHVLSFSVHQGGDGSFGLLYSGSAVSIEPTATPEPGTIFMLGGGLLGLAVVLRRRKQ
jgi:hypothetical protein